MMVDPMVFILLISTLSFVNGISINKNVEQIHLSPGTDSTEMLVTWTVPRSSAISHKGLVHYSLFFINSPNNNDQTVEAQVQQFKDESTIYLTYRALMTNLKPNSTYEYWIELGELKSAQYRFRTFPSEDTKWLPRFAIYGDLGYANDRSIPFLINDVNRGQLDAIFHVGDIAYDLQDNNGEVGHEFMRDIEPLSSRVPYITCPGNHEQYHNFSHYDSRFSMIGDRQRPNRNETLALRLNNHFHSIDIGPVHFILFSTEYYYFTEYGWDQIRVQFEWLEQDLRRANKNREKTPWIIVMGHRPLYCLAIGDESCTYRSFERQSIRQGIHMHKQYHEPRQYGLEDLFYKYGVDMQFYGHEHYYARLLPFYNYTVKSGNRSNPYDHPTGPVHIITGSAGNKEGHAPFNYHLQSWVARHFFDYGYTRLIFNSEFHVKLQQISVDQDGKVLDEINLLKSTPYPQWMNPLKNVNDKLSTNQNN